MDCSPPASSVYGISPGKNTGVGSHSLLWGIFLTQGSNLDLLHCRRTLYHLSHCGSPGTTHQVQADMQMIVPPLFSLIQLSLS